MSSVKLYVYDLSNGMAKALSLQLTGRQIDGIWHTSVVVFGKEVFYGQGISITAPGKSHHGSPLQIVDMGETALDEDTFNDYIEDMRSHYTADKYHLLDFNCNSFTNDVIGFLTGGSIPDFIKNLPSDFLSTPFGQALRPTIDSMYTGRPAPTQEGDARSQLASSLLQSVASQAQANGTAAPPPTQSHSSSLSSPLHPCTNLSSFNSLLGSHKGVVAYFTSQGCPPCRVIEPIFERLAEEKGIPANGASTKKGPAFTKIDLGVGNGREVAAQYNVSATPTFIFFLDGKKTGEIKGANAAELRSQVDMLIFQAYPPHPHTSVSLPAIEALSLKPILFQQVPQLDTALNKLSSSIPEQSSELKASTTALVSWLKTRFSSAGKSTTPPTTNQIQTWVKTTTALVNLLPIESLFPLVDMWRLAILDSTVATWISTQLPSTPDPFKLFLSQYIKNQQKPHRAYSLTLLRLFCNSFAHANLCQSLVTGQLREGLTKILVSSLLNEDKAVRTAGASLAFNCTAAVQQARVDDVRAQAGYLTDASDIKVQADQEQDEDWHVELASAIVEALQQEENDDVVHRLVASLACLLRLSPFGENALSPLLDVLQAKAVLEAKSGSKKEEVKKLVRDVIKLL